MVARDPVTNVRLCCVNHSVSAKLLGDENLQKQLKPHIPSGSDVSNFFFPTTDDAVTACKHELAQAGQTFEAGAGANSDSASAPSTVFSEREPVSSEVQRTESVDRSGDFDPEEGLRRRTSSALEQAESQSTSRIALGGGNLLEEDD